MAFHPEDRVVASCSAHDSIKLWNLDDGGLISTMKVDDIMVSSVVYSPDGSKLAAAHYKTVSIFNMETNEVLCTVSCDSPVYSIDWHDNRLVAGCDDGTIQVFDAQSGDRLSTVNVGYAFSRFSTRISLPARPLF